MDSYRFQKIAETHLKVKLKSGTEWMALCPFHDNRSTPSLQFNIATGLWVCFVCPPKQGAKGSHLGGTAQMLVEMLGGSYRDPGARLEDVQASLATIRKDVSEAISPPGFNGSTWTELPESHLRRYLMPGHEEYWVNRGIAIATVHEWKLGYDPLNEVATIPWRGVDGKLYGVIYRRTDGGFPKYRYPKGFPRKSSLYGSWRVAKSPNKRAAIVEGAVDTISCWQANVPALGQYGSSITPQQIQLLKRLGLQEVTLFYDDDSAGFEATVKALEMIRGLLIRRVRYIPELRRRYNGRSLDPGILTPGEIRHLYQKAVYFRG